MYVEHQDEDCMHYSLTADIPSTGNTAIAMTYSPSWLILSPPSAFPHSLNTSRYGCPTTPSARPQARTRTYVPTGRMIPDFDLLPPERMSTRLERGLLRGPAHAEPAHESRVVQFLMEHGELGVREDAPREGLQVVAVSAGEQRGETREVQEVDTNARDHGCGGGGKWERSGSERWD